MITGGTGYLGSALAELAVRKGYDVRVLVRDPRKAAQLLPGVADVVVGDLADADAVRRAVHGCHAVLHLAGSVESSAEATRRANVEGTRAVLAAAVDAGVTRFVYTSSSAAVIDSAGLVAESPAGAHALTDPYSVSKALPRSSCWRPPPTAWARSS